MDTGFVKLPHCGGKTCFLLTRLIENGKEGFELNLTDGDKFWEGKLTEEDLDVLSSNLKMDFNTYVSHTVKAFTHRNMEDVRFVYQMKQQAKDVVDFQWKKEADDNVKILMGSVTLHQLKNNTKALTQLFSSCIDMSSELQQKIRTLETDNQRLTHDRQNALKRLNKCVEAKEELEQQLFSKFSAVLNSKKERIRHLENNQGALATAEDDPVPSTSDEVANGKRGKSKKVSTPAPIQAEDQEDPASNAGDEDRDTDDETPPRKRPAIARAAAKLDEDSSLILGDDDDDEDDRVKNKVVRRPARRRGGNKRQTPAKPVLPKLTSPPSDSGKRRIPQRGSLRKSGSGNSERSSGNLDTDELLDNF